MSAANPNEYPVPETDAVDALHDAPSRHGWLADERPSPEQVEIYRRMTPGRRLEIAEGLCWTARRMKAAWLRVQHPDWPEAQVTQEVARIFSHARS